VVSLLADSGEQRASVQPSRKFMVDVDLGRSSVFVAALFKSFEKL
jgi:hypothetical protein